MSDAFKFVFVFQDGAKESTDMTRDELLFVIKHLVIELDTYRNGAVLDATPAGIHDARH